MSDTNRERISSSRSDSSSQSGMADTEADAERSQQSEVSTPAAAPMKKKRTRTLTTPHQSAVLHALLSQSRFPTTAMREEVGRQIGLSARKVQIWFQNQRQKARRPQSDGSASQSRQPQFSPFQNAPSSSHSEPSPLYMTAEQNLRDSPSVGQPNALAGPSGSRDTRAELPSRAGDHRAEYYREDIGPQLSGPGMPGWDTRHITELSHPRREISLRASHSFDIIPDPPQSLLVQSEADRDTLVQSMGMHRTLAPRPPHMQPSQAVSDSGYPSRMLPPIDFVTSRYREPEQATSQFRAHVLEPPSVNFTPSTSSIQFVPDRSALGIPPPFALEPPPQWDPHAFSPSARPEFMSWSTAVRPSISERLGPGGGPHRSTHNFPPATVSDQSYTGAVLPLSGSSSLSSRFDPVHDVIRRSQGRTPSFPPCGHDKESDDEQ